MQKAQARLETIDKVITKLYTDNAEGRIDDDRLDRMLTDLQKETEALERTVKNLSGVDPVTETKHNYQAFFELTNRFSHIDELDRDTLVTFVERIEVGPKILPEGTEKTTHRNQPFQQVVRIYYRFIGEKEDVPVRDFPAMSEG